ncbi:hypothetical protein KJD96_19565 [Escherichia marmotae]|uniref:Fimbrial protein n=2 Tax=Escherichia marmotae TaxID=1499973 RepID=A0ABU1C5M8_9ESCH|nr:hypothetical protein [Escherichia marmotae]HAM4877259.1 hypothetical protein [Escherichia coli]MDQ9215044.1 hypothetical protein [Escherichia marmotae]MDQ9229639.1 hypothetical protein [Escherichia marmotae]MDQ9234243.1 hypothetical protein [Escherichia marmotae]MDQ9239607.1 hypothetical protein [Escherichia marmotae]
MSGLQQKWTRLGVAALVLLVAGGIIQSSVAATVTQPDDKSSATIVIPVTLINIQATCDVTFSGAGLGSTGGTYTLGRLSKGEGKGHEPFRAAVECRDMDGTETVSTALTASVRTGALTGNNSIRMLVDGQDDTDAPELWLEKDGHRIPLDGSAFCKGNGLNRNECTLTPHTRVPDNSPGGELSATVVFDVTYV